MPDVRGLARRIHAYMSSPDCEGGDGPATALGKIEAAIRKEYAKVEAEIKRLTKLIDDHNARMAAIPTVPRPQSIPEGLQTLAAWFDLVYQDAGTNDEVQQDLRQWAIEIERLQHDAALVAFLSRPDVIVGLSEGAEVLVRIRESECEGCGDNVISAARMAMFMEQKQAAEAEEG